jgi:hypothetical protein
VKKTVFYYGVGMPAGVAATLLFVGSPFIVREFDVHDAPEAPPLAALAAVVSTATGTVIDAVSDEPIDVRPHHVVFPSRTD